MNIRKIALLCAFITIASAGYAQSVTLAADLPAVSAGSVLRLTASVAYPVTPGAVGWAITLPEGWSFVATAGPDVPQVGPQDGATGTLEWAYAEVPAGAARFSFTVKTSGRPGALQVMAKVFLRVDGRQQTIEATPVKISVAP